MKLKEKRAVEYARPIAKPELRSMISMSRSVLAEMLAQASLAGFEAAKTEALRDVTDWLEVTGVIPKGVSYYNELLGSLRDLGDAPADESDGG